ncbi:MAG: zinc-dependent alcohol dehydrogenase family protein [Anaerolineales bacterium]|nr:zinc-dependent alcohol dehydrogenase family protein [Anaerolineales bacterium]
MKAFRIFQQLPIEQQPLRRVELPIPEPGPGQALLQVICCGVCHTDLHTVEGDICPPRLPLTPGHQVVGRIVQTGSLPETWPEDRPRPAPGQRVGVAWLHAACGRCTFCQAGQENLCTQATFTGFHTDGGYAEYLLADLRYLMPLPEGLPDAQAAPLLCAGIIGYRSLRLADLQPGERLGLAGFGASAHLAIQVARHWGCQVFVFTRSPEHRQHALDLGAAWAGSIEMDPGVQLDRAILFAPSGSLVPPLLSRLRPAGTLAINAIHLSDIPALPYGLIYGERTLRSVANATYQDGLEFLRLATEIPIRPDVRLYPLDEANQALAALKHSRLIGEAVLMV